MNKIVDDWRFRAAILSLGQKKDANGRAKIRKQIVVLLRSDYQLTQDDKLALADFFEEKPRGRRKGAVQYPQLHRAVQEIRAIKARHRVRLEAAIERYRASLHLRPDRTELTYFANNEDQIRIELSRSSKSSKN